MVSTVDTFSEVGFSKFPYVSLKIIEAKNLRAFSEYNQDLRPYVRITKGNYISRTKTATTGDEVIWNETFEISGEGFDSLVVCLMDSDEFDGDIVLVGFSIPMELVKH